MALLLCDGLTQMWDRLSQTVSQPQAWAKAPANIALIKYWGKRDSALNLPVTSSLSLTLPGLDVTTSLAVSDSSCYVVNGEEIALESQFATRLTTYLKQLTPQLCWRVETESTMPIAAGLASSAAGFAALVKALNEVMGWQLSLAELSVLARLGSGSACRSLWDGFVLWQRGSDEAGLDSHGIPLTWRWPQLRVGIVIVDDGLKPISSREAMNQTVSTSPLYCAWPNRVEADLAEIKQAIQSRQFELMGQISEDNAKAMHATMMLSKPSCVYSTDKTRSVIAQVAAMRKQGIAVYYTQDAGPNIKLLFLANDQARIESVFELSQVIVPFNE